VRGVNWRQLLLDLGALSAAIFIALVAINQSRPFALDLPFEYAGDALYESALAKAVQREAGAPFQNDHLAAPFGAERSDRPQLDRGNLALMQALSWVTPGWVELVNLFLIASYFTVGWAAYAAMRGLGVDRPWAILGGLLFSFLPYHDMRITLGHFRLASYFCVPIACWLAVDAWRRGLAGAEDRLMRPALLLRIVALVLAGCGGAYYALFGIFLTAVAGVAAVMQVRRARAAMPALLVAGGLVVVLALQMAPTIRYQMKHGPNPEVLVRAPGEAEFYGLKVVQLLLPRPDHRWDVADRLQQRYALAAPLVNENRASALGALGAIGFIGLALVAFRRLVTAGGCRDTLGQLAVLALSLVALASVGGLGSMLAFEVTDKVRAYNRVSVFIGFFALSALCLVLQRALHRDADRRSSHPVMVAALVGGLAIFGIWDQTSSFERVGVEAYQTDREFVRALEQRVPAGAMVYQMPYRPFPEAPPMHAMKSYDSIRGYLHSDTLRWSAGAARGRESGQWSRAMSALPVEQQLSAAATSGFQAVVLDRRGYVDNRAEAGISAVLGPPIVASADGAMVAWPLRATGTTPVPFERIMGQFGDEWSLAMEDLPPIVATLSGFGEPEPWGRWTVGPVARIEFARALPARFILRLQTLGAMRPDLGVSIRVRAGAVTRNFVLRQAGETAEIDFDGVNDARSIEIEIPHPVAPRDMGMNDDPRPLGIGIRSLTIRVPAGP
jgi:phosphoglycerol transferase